MATQRLPLERRLASGAAVEADRISITFPWRGAWPQALTAARRRASGPTETGPQLQT